MKRYGNLYDSICSLENIQLAYKNAKKGKSKYKEIIEIEKNKDFYLKKIQEMLVDQTFKNSKYRIFKKKFKNKIREIYVLPFFPDRIIHHCIMNVLEPIWKKTLIRDTFSSIKGRGIHDCLKRIKSKELPQYCLKIDIQKFYPSVNNNILKQIIVKKIKCKKTLKLLFEIINSTVGVPIGNYLSQYLGNLYLSGLDHLLKEIEHCKLYFRYCDDMVILHKSKEKLHLILSAINNYLNKLKLKLKNNYQIFNILKRPIDFVGYLFYTTYILIRKSIKQTFKKKVKYIKENNPANKMNILASYKGWFSFAKCINLFRSSLCY